MISFIFFSILSVTSALLTPVSSQDIQGFNSILALTIAPTDYVISKEIKAAGLDPLQQGIEGNVSTVHPAGICKELIDVKYSISRIHGLSTVAVENFEIINAQKSVDGGVILDLLTSIKPYTLTANIDGGLKASCGFIKPSASIKGYLLAEKLKLALQLQISALPAPNEEWALDIKITDVKVDFKDVIVHLRGFDVIFNPLLDFIMRAVENTFKSKIQDLLDTQIKDQVNQLIQVQLGNLYKSWNRPLGRLLRR